MDVDKTTNLMTGDCRQHMKEMQAESVHCVVSSPPYWGGIRDYQIPSLTWADGWTGDFGNEPTIEMYLAHTLEIFDGLRRVLRDDGVIFWNIGDTYAVSGRGGNPQSSEHQKQKTNEGSLTKSHKCTELGAGNKCLIPHRVAIVLQEAGWIVRQDIVWCLSGGSWIYARTQKGERPEMLKDLVRLDPSTVQLWNGSQWTQVVSWTESRSTENKLELVFRSGERVGCTGSHVWPTQRGNVRADELSAGDVVATTTLPEPENASCPKYLTVDALWLIGLFLAEGSRNRKSGNADNLSFALHKDEANEWFSRIEAVAKHFGGSASKGVCSENGAVVRVYGRVLVSTVEQYISGSVAMDKRLSSAAWSLPNNALRHLVQGYLDGDGHDDPQTNRHRLGFCRNYSLERDLRCLAARLGARIKLTPMVATYQDGKRPSFRGEWRWSREGTWADYGEIIEIRRSRARRFYDVEVADDPHLFALSSGVLTHNSKKSPMPESVNGVRWERCRVKTCNGQRSSEAKKQAVPGKPHSARTEDGKNFDAKTEYQECPGCKKCEANDGYVLRRGSWRPTNAHEYIFMVTKTNDYFCDADAIKEPTTGNAHSRGGGVNPKAVSGVVGNERQNGSFSAAVNDVVETRNPRSVWTLSNEPYKGAHFAAYPSELVYRCLKAGVSQYGCCDQCGSQFAPVIERSRKATRPGNDTKVDGVALHDDSLYQAQAGTIVGNRDPLRHTTVTNAIGSRPTCTCEAPKAIPATVYDPFSGSGTTMQVAYHMGLNAIGSEHGEQYLPLIQERIETRPRCFPELPKRAIESLPGQQSLFEEFETSSTGKCNK